MFFRSPPPVEPPPALPVPAPAPPASRPGKVLPPIPFSPDWALPTAPPPPVLPERPAAAAEMTDLPLILAEADAISRDLICGLAARWGYRVIPASGGLEAFAAIGAQTEPALAVIDWQMAGMSGIEVCREARRMNHPVYIILVTERSGAEQLGAALEAGADDYLITPFDADELRARIGVGARVIGLQSQLATVQHDLAAADARVQALITSAAQPVAYPFTSQ